MEFTLEEYFEASPETIYKAWLDSDEHSEMTGGADALITDEVGEPYNAWDGYIWGKTLELKPNEFIRQSWRTDEFEDEQPYSFIEITLKPEGSGTRLTLKHAGLSENDEKYKQGWVDNYFVLMKKYFES
jgi:uncharacterized protein YndB with AHSA1/START domain